MIHRRLFDNELPFVKHIYCVFQLRVSIYTYPETERSLEVERNSPKVQTTRA